MVAPSFKSPIVRSTCPSGICRKRAISAVSYTHLDVYKRQEYERGFVFIGSSKHLIRRPAVRYSEEAGEIPFVSFDPLGKDFHLVDLGSQFPAYRRMSFQLVFRDPPGTHGGILFLYHLGVGQSLSLIHIFLVSWRNIRFD